VVCSFANLGLEGALGVGVSNLLGLLLDPPQNVALKPLEKLALLVRGGELDGLAAQLGLVCRRELLGFLCIWEGGEGDAVSVCFLLQGRERGGTNLLDVFFPLDLLLLLATQELLELFPPRLHLFIA
jgi:hypothetical protein